ncbi:MAG: 3-deoxy-manno-octulosonate cytidylyltransferase [Gemmatimonadaceae bacterium]|nr:3-deoxy-manno-octulosonate cytidylyltransferase [Gemmatimonadaceae bacterium]MCW5825136.1 3-deoxy-manno-octulosonate cytidylyltransferase [Gemmatimonadaceae bacterium]
MSILAVIPARLGATRLPRKPLRLLAGTPLVLRVLQRVESLKLADEVVVATESEEVAKIVREAGGRAVLTSEAHPSGTDRVAEVAARPEFTAHDIIVNVQGDEPFMRGDAMAGAIAMVRERGFELGTAAGKRDGAILADANCVKVVRADDGRALYFSRAPIPFLREAADAPMRDGLILQHMGIYAARREALARWVSLPPHPLELVEKLEQLRALAAGMAMGVAIVDAPSWGEVNTEDDLESANAHWSALHAG